MKISIPTESQLLNTFMNRKGGLWHYSIITPRESILAQKNPISDVLSPAKKLLWLEKFKFI